jgi:transposase
VVRSGRVQVPPLVREDPLADHLDRIRELYATCEGNRVRVQEELHAQGVEVSYSTLTAFCRRHGIGVRPKERPGRYHFDPGAEMQHDTSPHKPIIGGRRRPVQCALLVLCYSWMMFSQVFLRFRRFECKRFLTDALQYFEGAAAQCMLDNSSVIMVSGTGPDAQPAPEMAAFARRYGFEFVAHRVGDANRSARVERLFHYIEHNFYPGRTFDSVPDLNAQLRDWCDQVNRHPKRHLQGTPIERLVAERVAMRPLPPYVPEVYELHSRRVDIEGYVCLHTNRYSVPTELIGRQVEVRETGDRVRIFQGPRLVVEHERLEPGLQRRVLLPEHQGQKRRRKAPPPSSPEEKVLATAAVELQELVAALRKQHGGQARRAVRRLYRIYMDYPLDSILPAVRQALCYRVLDLNRIESMILRRLQGEFFRLPTDSPEESDG